MDEQGLFHQENLDDVENSSDSESIAVNKILAIQTHLEKYENFFKKLSILLINLRVHLFNNLPEHLAFNSPECGSIHTSYCGRSWVIMK